MADFGPTATDMSSNGVPVTYVQDGVYVDVDNHPPAGEGYLGRYFGDPERQDKMDVMPANIVGIPVDDPHCCEALEAISHECQGEAAY